MPLDTATGVHFELHGAGRPLLVALPLLASHVEVFGEDARALLDGYLAPLVDRYRVLLVDYPSIGRSRDIAPEALDADRVCADLLGVATAAGFERFAYCGYSWGAQVGLQLATRSDRLTALAIGGWPPLGGLSPELLRAIRAKAERPEPSSMRVLRSMAQYRQWETFQRSVLKWPEAAAVSSLRLPRLVYFGGDGDLVEGGVPVPIASTLRLRRPELEAQGWRVVEFPGRGHDVTADTALVLPVLRAFLDEALP